MVDTSTLEYLERISSISAQYCRSTPDVAEFTSITVNASPAIALPCGRKNFPEGTLQSAIPHRRCRTLSLPLSGERVHAGNPSYPSRPINGSTRPKDKQMCLHDGMKIRRVTSSVCVPATVLCHSSNLIRSRAAVLSAKLLMLHCACSSTSAGQHKNAKKITTSTCLRIHRRA